MRFNAKALVSFIAACIGLIALSLDGAYAAAEIRDICPAEFTSFDSPHLTSLPRTRHGWPGSKSGYSRRNWTTTFPLRRNLWNRSAYWITPLPSSRKQ